MEHIRAGAVCTSTPAAAVFATFNATNYYYLFGNSYVYQLVPGKSRIGMCTLTGGVGGGIPATAVFELVVVP